MDYSKEIWLIRAKGNTNSALTMKDRSTYAVFEDKDTAEIAAEYLRKLNEGKGINFKVVKYAETDN